MEGLLLELHQQAESQTRWQVAAIERPARTGARVMSGKIQGFLTFHHEAGAALSASKHTIAVELNCLRLLQHLDTSCFFKLREEGF